MRKYKKCGDVRQSYSLPKGAGSVFTDMEIKHPILVTNSLLTITPDQIKIDQIVIELCSSDDKYDRMFYCEKIHPGKIIWGYLGHSIKQIAIDILEKEKSHEQQ